MIAISFKRAAKLQLTHVEPLETGHLKIHLRNKRLRKLLLKRSEELVIALKHNPPQLSILTLIFSFFFFLNFISINGNRANINPTSLPL